MIVSAFVRRRAQAGTPAFPLAGPVAAPVSLLGLQGLLYVVVLKNQSWWHDYWQLLLAPFVASAMAAFAVLVARLSARRSRRLATVAVTAVLAAPMPWAAAALDF
jgi:lipopolysaccharide export LptBFGC system permease protein LptF